MSVAENPREVIGGNQPPGALQIGAEPVEGLRRWLAANPAVTNEDEAREAKAHLDRALAAMKDVETERRGLVDPLNAQVKAINAEYHQMHNTDAKRPGLWDKLVAELKSRITSFARLEERKRHEAEEAARRVAEEAAEAARLAKEAEAQAREEVAHGVCDVDLAGIAEQAHAASQTAIRADWTARRAEASTKVRITGGFGKAISLRDHESLTVTDWYAAIKEMSGHDGNIPAAIADAIITCARLHKKTFGDLPAGVEANYERSL